MTGAYERKSWPRDLLSVFQINADYTRIPDTAVVALEPKLSPDVNRWVPRLLCSNVLRPAEAYIQDVFELHSQTCPLQSATTYRLVTPSLCGGPQITTGGCPAAQQCNELPTDMRTAHTLTTLFSYYRLKHHMGSSLLFIIKYYVIMLCNCTTSHLD